MTDFNFDAFESDILPEDTDIIDPYTTPLSEVSLDDLGIDMPFDLF